MGYKQDTTQQLAQYKISSEDTSFHQIKSLLKCIAHVDVAHLIESSPPKERKVLWDALDESREGEVLQFLSDDVRAEFLLEMDHHRLARMTEGLEADDIADMLQQLPTTITQMVLESMDQQDRQRVEAVLSYPEDTAGGLMNPDMITVRPSLTLDVVLRYLRRHKQLPDMTDSLFVVNRKDTFIGTLSISKILVSDPSISVREVMDTEVTPIQATIPSNEVAQQFTKLDLVSAPVVNEQGMLVGRITIDDIVDVIREEADHTFMSQAGLDQDEDTFAPISRTLKRRAMWLAVNLATVWLLAAVLSLFTDAIEKVSTLALLYPIAMSMGGIAGSQTLTIVIRGRVMGHITRSNKGWLLSKELYVGFINGFLWALLTGLGVMLFYQDWVLATLLATAMLINFIAAALIGALLPELLQKKGIDPALAGGVILTTFTDIIGAGSFLALATLVYFSWL